MTQLRQPPPEMISSLCAPKATLSQEVLKDFTMPDAPCDRNSLEKTELFMRLKTPIPPFEESVKRIMKEDGYQA
tara:strand:+ start:298 stop:519 length:222 start_codon:yes stop_codon:yes gene_type:complete